MLFRILLGLVYLVLRETVRNIRRLNGIISSLGLKQIKKTISWDGVFLVLHLRH